MKNFRELTILESIYERMFDAYGIPAEELQYWQKKGYQFIGYSGFDDDGDFCYSEMIPENELPEIADDEIWEGDDYRRHYGMMKVIKTYVRPNQ